MERRRALNISPDPLQSPCVRNCCLDEKDVCVGCGRSLEEIRVWSSLDEGQRRAVLEQARIRLHPHDGMNG